MSRLKDAIQNRNQTRATHISFGEIWGFRLSRIPPPSAPRIYFTQVTHLPSWSLSLKEIISIWISQGDHCCYTETHMEPISIQKMECLLRESRKKVAFPYPLWQLVRVCQSWGFSSSGNWAAFACVQEEQRLPRTRLKILGSTVPLPLTSCMTLG